ncbi:MAG: hypothetical protein ACYTHJ_07155 [Planctomycetota bacterium]|jgi:hypothetical protein
MAVEPSIQTSEPPGAAPDWNLVPFDVSCARCGENLNGRDEPACPACALKFDWAIAVPIEELACPDCQYRLFGLTKARCPECGLAFEWHEVLDDHRKRQKPLFEYQWHERPISSFIRSWAKSWRPWRLWREVEIHDPAPMSAFIMHMMVLFIACMASLLAMAILVRVLWSVFPVGRTLSMQWMLIGPWGTWSEFNAFAKNIMLVGGGWLFGLLIGQLILRESMARCRIRDAQIFRVNAYAITPILSIPPIICFFFFALDVASIVAGTRIVRPVATFGAVLAGVSCTLIVVAIIIQILSIAHGYGRYIRMEHSFGVMVTTHLIWGIWVSNVVLWLTVW